MIAEGLRENGNDEFMSSLFVFLFFFRCHQSHRASGKIALGANQKPIARP